MSELELHYADEWAALYVDGELDASTVGDSYIAEAKALRILGVRIVQDDAFMRGQNARDGVAKNLDEVTAYREQRERRLAEAAKLRADAQALLDQAQALEAPAEG